MNIVIGLIGAKGAGKTTAFNVIKELADVQEITLASKLKDVCARVFGIPRDHFDSHKYKESEMAGVVYLDPLNIMEVFGHYGILKEAQTFEFYDKYVRPHVGKTLFTPRKVAQYVGTEVLRAYQADIHCDSAVSDVGKEIGVVTDLRFPNEFEYFEARYSNFHPVYIPCMRAEMAAGTDTHASEAHLKELASKAEYIIPNNDSIKEFEERVRKVLGGLL